MPRTVEGIVEAHQIARERRAAGKSPWNGTLDFMRDLRPLVEAFQAGDESVTSQKMLDAFKAAVAEVRAKVPEAKGDIVEMEHEDLEYFVGELEGWTLASLEASPDIVEEFDNALERLYDWCDRYRWFISI